MSIPIFNPNPTAQRAFRNVTCGERIIPLSEGNHLHTYHGEYHMADNFKKDVKIYYDLSSDGIGDIRLKVPGINSIDL